MSAARSRHREQRAVLIDRRSAPQHGAAMRPGISQASMRWLASRQLARASTRWRALVLVRCQWKTSEDTHIAIHTFIHRLQYCSVATIFSGILRENANGAREPLFESSALQYAQQWKCRRAFLTVTHKRNDWYSSTNVY